MIKYKARQQTKLKGVGLSSDPMKPQPDQPASVEQLQKLLAQERLRNKLLNANKPLKALLQNGAMSAIQHSQELKAYYNRKTAEGKNEIRTADAVSHQ